MQVPSQKPPISSAYLNMLQSRQATPVAARGTSTNQPAPTSRPLDPGSAPRGPGPAPRGSIVDIKV
jgi:hypothetical protein